MSLGWPHQLAIIWLWLQALCSLTWSGTEAPWGVGSEGCNSCPPGYGVVSVCNKTHDTRCAPCPQGTYNARHTLEFPCNPCSVCGEFEYERLPCTARHDTLCKSCFAKGGGGFGNEDFLKKCESLPTTTSTTTTTAASKTQGNAELQNDKSSKHDDMIQNDGEPDSVETEEGSGELIVDMPGKPAAKMTPTTTTTTTKTTTMTTTSEPVEIKTRKIQATTKTKASAEKLTPYTEEEVTITEPTEINEVPVVGAQRAAPEDESSHKGFFQWPVLVAALVAAVVCFVLGVLVSALVHKQRSSSQEKLAYAVDDDVTTSMITPRRGNLSPNATYPDETGDAKTPIYIGKHY